ncbi:MAG: hypothetical protein C4345_01895, partial [Chloroflexota bacterium]
GLARLITSFVTMGLNLAIMLALDAQLTLVAMSVVPLIFFYQRKMRDVMPLWREVQKRMADLNVVIQENVAGIKLVKAFNREPYEAQRFNEVNWDIRQKRLKSSLLMGFIMPGQEFAASLSTVIILAVGAARVMDGNLTIGSLLAFNSYALAMWMPIRFFGFINQMAQQAIAAGAAMVNDLTGLEDPDMRRVVAGTGAAAVLMHLKDRPKISRARPEYRSLLGDIVAYFQDRVDLCLAAGISRT